MGTRGRAGGAAWALRIKDTENYYLFYLSNAGGENATSYFLTLDNIFNNPAWPLFGDRNLRFNGLANCVNGINNADRLSSFFTGQSEWTNAVHGLQGNIVRLDGGVHETSGDQMRAILRAGISDDFSLHFLRAR